MVKAVTALSEHAPTPYITTLHLTPNHIYNDREDLHPT